jgi:putative SOS response-associated peptidase YedK
MCNLYRMTKGTDEVASWFEASGEMGGANFGSEVYPGYPGAVVAEGKDSFQTRRCLIPLTSWAEAQGAKGAMRRTWMSLPDTPIFAAAGVWRKSDEWGDCYSMVMTESAGAKCANVHARMPVILAKPDYAGWTLGAPDAALDLCRAFTGDLVIEPTDEPWSKAVRSSSDKPQGQGAQGALF